MLISNYQKCAKGIYICSFDFAYIDVICLFPIIRFNNRPQVVWLIRNLAREKSADAQILMRNYNLWRRRTGSKLLKDPDIRLSQSLAVLIEEKYGYSAAWVLNGTEPKLKQISKDKSLSEIHQKALAQLERMNDEQIKAVLAFINSLDELEKSLRIAPQNSKE